MGKKLAHAIKLQQEALRDNKAAAALAFHGNAERAAGYQIDAACRHDAAARLMTVDHAPIIVSGEVVPGEAERPDDQGGWAIRNTLSSPDSAAVDASIARTDLLMQANGDALALGVDAAESADCHNSLEKMLAHQMALAHQAAVRLLNTAMQQSGPSDMARLLNASARLMSVYQRAMLTFHRVRNGGHQTVTVQHVTIHGGQAVVAGSLPSGGGNGSRGSK